MRYAMRRVRQVRLRICLLGAVAGASALAGLTVSVPVASAGEHGTKVDPRLGELVDKKLERSPTAEARVIAYGTDAVAALKDAGARHVKRLDVLPGASGTVLAADVDAIAADPRLAALDADVPVRSTALGDSVATLYPQIDGAEAAWSSGYDGSGVGVAVVDSGVASVSDLAGRATSVAYDGLPVAADARGHGTFVTSIVGGLSSDGRYAGVAPAASLFALNVDRQQDGIYTSDVVQALGWLAVNGRAAGIRVVNLSLSESVPSSYRTNALDLAVESGAPASSSSFPPGTAALARSTTHRRTIPTRSPWAPRTRTAPSPRPTTSRQPSRRGARRRTGSRSPTCWPRAAASWQPFRSEARSISPRRSRTMSSPVTSA